MRKRNNFSIDPKYLLVFFLIVCLLLIVTSYKFKDNYSPVRAVVGDVVTPMQKGINGVALSLVERWNCFRQRRNCLLRIRNYKVN